MDFKNSKIAVIGIGGVGGYVGAMLADHYDKVTLVARGKRKETIEAHGLVLHSDFRGERTVYPYQVVESASELDVQDYIFICVKNYSLEEIGPTLINCVDQHTVIIPVMNGADPGERTRAMISKGTILDSLIYIIAFANADFSVSQQGMYSDIYLGKAEASEEEMEMIHCATALLNGAEINCHEAEDIHRAIWKKYIFNCAYNVETAAYNNNIGELRSDPCKVKQFEGLIHEAYAVAKAKQIHVTDEDIENLLHRFYVELPDPSTSSLQRDVAAGKRAEIETFSGYLAREGKRLGLEIPVTTKMYSKLLEITHK